MSNHREPTSARRHRRRHARRWTALLGAGAATLGAVVAAGGAPADAGAPIEGYHFDQLTSEGYVRDVCAGGMLPGTRATFDLLQSQFGGQAGSSYNCRDRASDEPGCDFRSYDEVAEAGVYSTCFSGHAQGRSIDIMMDCRSGCPDRGLRIISWLLAPDTDGNPHAMARRLGVQQIIFSDRCWNTRSTSGDQAVHTFDQMRPCDQGHFDHIHLDLTVAGANGQTSYWAGAVAPPLPSAPPAGPADAHQPIGDVNDVFAHGPGAIGLWGWAADPDTPATAIPVDVYVRGLAGGERFYRIDADDLRADVDVVHPGLGTHHGFEAVLSDLPSGTATVDVYGIDSSDRAGDYVHLESHTVTVP